MPLSRSACSRLAVPSHRVAAIFGDVAIRATAANLDHPWRRVVRRDVWTALTRFVKSGWRLALATLLFLPMLALATCEPQLPSVPDAAPIVVPLPDVAADVWESRGHVVHLEPYNYPPLDGDSVLGEAWRAVYTSVSGVDGGIREVSERSSFPAESRRTLGGQSSRSPMERPASDTTAGRPDSRISWATHR